MAGFAEDYSGAVADQLGLSYRSTKQIVDTVVAIAPRMGASTGMLPLALTADRESGPAKPDIRRYDTLDHEIEGIAASVRELEAAGVGLRDQAVLCRSNNRLNEIAAGLETRGFRAVIHERLFDADFRRQADEPAVALCGLDNATGRRALDQVGFDFIVEAGLGRGHRDFRTMRLHVLPGARPSAEIRRTAPPAEKLDDRPAYTRLLADGTLDQCGMTLLAGKAVGAPFVGAVAATLALAEVLRLLHGGAIHRLLDVDLLSLDQRIASHHPGEFSALNPGYTLAE